MQRPSVLAPALALAIASLAAQQPSYHAAREPATDALLSTLPGETMLSLPGLFTDFVISGGGQFVELPNGTARLTGRVFSSGSLYSAFLFDIQFANKVSPGTPAYPPAGTPDLQMLPSAYVPTGTIDPGTFDYYTSATGTLTGVRNYDGAVLGLQLSSPAAQLGIGANNRNGEFGMSASFTISVIQQSPQPLPTVTTAELSLDLPTDRTDDATHPQPDPLRTTLPFGRAMVLPGVNDDYLFVPAGEFTEYDDGHAELTGRLASIAQLDDAWDVTLQLTNRIDPGQTGYPPTGSPVLQMLPSAYQQNGGTMDPSHWHYYQTATGTLTGRGINAGGSITLQNSTAVQYGAAANQTNTYYGYYGAFTTVIGSQPTSRTIAITGDAELSGSLPCSRCCRSRFSPRRARTTRSRR